MKKRNVMIPLMLWVFAVGASVTARAADPSECPVADGDLETIRGGYVTDGGLQISFGLERAISVGGVLQTITTISLPGIEALGQAASAGSLASSTASLVQNGLGNLVAANFSQLSQGLQTVVQNSLDRQIIQNVTKLDVEVTSLSLFREMNLTSSLSRQAINSLR